MKTRSRRTLVSMLFVLFLVLCVLVGISLYNGISVVSAQAATVEPTDLTFMLNDDNQSYKVRVLDKTVKSITIPSSYDGLPVTAIDDSGFTGCTALEKVVIPSSIKHIGNNAFMRCTKLKKVLGMSGVTTYGNNAFSLCSSLEYLILPSGLQSVGSSMLRSVKATVYSRTPEEDFLQLNSTSLTSFLGTVVYGNDLVYEKYTDSLTGEDGVSLVSWQNIDMYPDGFGGETTLIVESWRSDNREDIADADKIEGKVLNIAQWAFADCNAENIIIENATGYNHAINLESYAFAQCKAKNITIKTAITMNDPMDGVSIATFYDSSALSSVSLPDGLEAISFQMFMDCKALQEINFLNNTNNANFLPDSIKRIESQAFYSCYNVPELHISENIEFIGQNAFYYWGGNEDLYQNIYINLEKPDDNWNPLWDKGIIDGNCNLEFTGITELTIKFVVEQSGIVNPSKIDPITVNRNDTLNKLGISSPLSESHNFNGKWYTTESRSEGTEFAWDKQIKSDLILYAGWSIKNFTITFGSSRSCTFYDLHTHECLDSQVKQFKYGDSFSFYIETKNGYKNHIVYNNGTELKPATSKVYDITFTQNYSITAAADLIEYRIDFDKETLRKGTNPNGEVMFFTVESDTITLKKPTWAAYANGEWDTPYIPAGSTENRLVKAIWSNPISFNITFDLSGDPNASHSNGNTLTYTADKDVNISAPTSLGYKKGQWKIYGTSTIINNGWRKDTYWRDIKLVADWSQPNEYNISFDLNGGSGNSTSITVKYGDYLPTKTKPTKYDYKFLGYYSVNNGQAYYSSNMGRQKWYQTANDTLEARWEQEYFYVTFEQRNGTGIGGTSSIRIKYGDEWPTISMPTRKGYSVDGYYYMYDIENRKMYNGDGTPNPNNIVSPNYFHFKQNITLRCNWQVEDYYGFIIEQIHVMEDSATVVEKYYLPYDGSFEYTADERRTWTEYTQDGKSIVQRESRAFTRWVMNINGPQDYDPQTNPWIIISTDRHISYDVATIIEQYYPDYVPTPSPGNIHIRAIYKDDYKNELTCVAEGTLITLADGSQVPVEQLKGDENLLVWNMLTGNFDVAPILFIDHEPVREYETISLYFSDGTNVKIMGEHGFWDFNLNKYVYLNNSASQYIGHWFNKQTLDENGQMAWTRVQLTSVVITEEYTTTWSPVTYGHLCYYVNGMLSMPGGISGLFNIFDVNEDMMFDAVAMDTDIQTYGLFTYEEFAEIVPVPEEIFNAVSGQYLKVAIGKGLITVEGLQILVNRYSVFFE